MAQLSPDLQEKLSELEKELEVRLFSTMHVYTYPMSTFVAASLWWFANTSPPFP